MPFEYGLPPLVQVTLAPTPHSFAASAGCAASTLSAAAQAKTASDLIMARRHLDFDAASGAGDAAADNYPVREEFREIRLQRRDFSPVWIFSRGARRSVRKGTQVA